MREYAKTFKRRWYLYCLPPIVLALVLGAVTASKPKTYESSASLWVDNGPASGSSLVSTSSSGPATFQQTLLTELLATHAFDLAVGNSSELKNSVTGATTMAKRNAVIAAVQDGTGSSIAGPQVLQLTFKGSSAGVAQTALEAVISQLKSSTTERGQAFGRSSVSYYQSQLDTALKAQSHARAALADYQAAHPNATQAHNSTLATLTSGVSAATSQVSTVQQSLSEAQAEAKVGVNGATVSVVDPPSLPTATSTGKKKILELAVAGLLAGALVSLLIVIGLTKGVDDPWETELQGLSNTPTSSTGRGLVVRTSTRPQPRIMSRAESLRESHPDDDIVPATTDEEVDEGEDAHLGADETDPKASQAGGRKRRLGGPRNERETA